MQIAYFENSLVEHLGDDAGKLFSDIGLSNSNYRQVEHAGKLVTFIEITGDFDVSRCTRVVDAEEANAIIAASYVPTYSVANEAIFNASLNAKVADGSLNLDEFDESQSTSGQYHWLKLRGVKGIGVSQPPALFEETGEITGETYQEVR